MEFRCRLGTTSGEIIEGVYVAQSEAALRRELEDKGLHVLSLKPRLGLGQLSRSARRRKITRHEFLVFNQELATLLKAGMPLVQSLDILRTRLTNPVFKSVLDDVHEKVRGGTALSDAFAAHGDLFPNVYTASLMAGERSGNLDAVLRRFVAYSKTVDTVRTEDHLRDDLSGHPGRAGDPAGRHHRGQGGADVRGVLQQLRRGAAAVDARHRRHLGLHSRAVLADRDRRGRRRSSGS